MTEIDPEQLVNRIKHFPDTVEYAALSPEQLQELTVDMVRLLRIQTKAATNPGADTEMIDAMQRIISTYNIP